MADAPAPVLLADGVEVTALGVERFHYASEGGEPMAPMSLDEYRALEDEGEALEWWDGEWGREPYEQELPPESPASSRSESLSRTRIERRPANPAAAS